MGWGLVRKDVKGINWNEIIRSFCPVSTLNKALLSIFPNRVPKRMIVVRTGYKLWLMTSVSWLTVRSRGHMECRVVVGVGSMLTGRGIGWFVGMFSMYM